jgi:hypothetical protein
MRCEDCRPRLGEYADGELDARLAHGVGEHLAACPACAEAHEELLGEQQFMLRHYRRDLSVSHGAWANVLAGYKAAAPAPTSNVSAAKVAARPRWSPLAALGLAGLRPAFGVAAACLLLAAVTVYFVSRPGPSLERPEVADSATGGAGGGATAERAAAPRPGDPAPRAPQERADASAPTPTAPPPTTTPADAAARQTNVQTATTAASNNVRRGRGRHQVAASESASGSTRAPAPGRTPEGGGVAAAATGASAREAAARVETARHIEKVQVLLRSFQNRGAAVDGGELDLSYEKQLSRRLLSANVALRRELEGRGDLSSEAVLGDVEPFLADIAALPDKVLPADARRIEERLRREAVVSALPVYTAASRGEGF